MGLFGQGTSSPHISLFQRGTGVLHVVADLTDRLPLGRIQRVPGDLFQPFVGRTKPLFGILPLPQSLGGSDIRGDLLGRFACPAFAHHNLFWTIRGLRRCHCRLAWLRSRLRRGFLRRCRHGCCDRFSRRAFFRGCIGSGLLCRIRGRRRVLLWRNCSHHWKAKSQRNRKSAHQSHNGSNRIVSHQCQERKTRCQRISALYRGESPTRRSSSPAFQAVS